VVGAAGAVLGRRAPELGHGEDGRLAPERSQLVAQGQDRVRQPPQGLVERIALAAVRGGRLFGGWPGLDESALYDRRDLMPLDDVRRYAAWVLRGLYGIEAGTLGSVVFPGLDLGDDPGVLV
jgi:hypothetical protein